MRCLDWALCVGILLLKRAGCAEVEVEKVDSSIRAVFNDAVRNYVESAQKDTSGTFFDASHQDQMFASMVETLPVDEETYDYIVVGGGASGCPLANVLAEAGAGLADPTISQVIGTAGGIRTFSGAVMGGGSSINIGIAVAENEDFFVEMAKQFPGFNIDYSKLREAYDFVAERLLTPMPTLKPFGPAFKEALHGSGYEYWGHSDPPQPSLFPQIGYEWQGLSFFDKSFQRRASDSLIDESPFITVKTRHTVRSVTFVENEHGAKVANCVIYRPTRYTDIRPMGDVWSVVPSSNANWAPWIGIFIEPSSVLTIAGVNNPFLKMRRVCLTHPGQGRIILSTGAVHTPLVLFRSGIGPAQQVRDLKVPLVFENEAVGTFGDRMFLTIPAFMQNFSDEVSPSHPHRRVRRLAATEDASAQAVSTLQLKRSPELVTKDEQGERRTKLDVPESLVTVVEHEEKEASPRGLPLPQAIKDLPFMPYSQALIDALGPRISQFMGLRYVGPCCEGQGINQRNLGCSLVPIQELSGDRTAEGFIYATRFIFPTSIRTDPLIDILMELLQACAEFRAPFGVLALKPVCALAQPLIMCFRRVVAPFYFTSEPKSRGIIRMTPDGDVHVNPKYLTDEQDLADAVRGVTTLIEELDSGHYSSVIQRSGPTACPVTIANGLLDILLAIGASATPLLKNGNANFAVIQRFLQGLLPTNARRLRRLVVLEANTEMKPGLYTDEEGREFEDYSAFVVHGVDEAKLERLGLKRRLEAKAIEACQVPCSRVEGSRNDCPKADFCCLAYGNAKCVKAPGMESFIEAATSQERRAAAARADASKMEEMFLPSVEFPGVPPPRPVDYEDKAVASYPPNLPDVNDPQALAQFARSYMTSLGHLYGSAQMGKVVDDKFRVVGVEGLSVVDASILPQLTRMNPALTLMALGRYAGQMLLGI